MESMPPTRRIDGDASNLGHLKPSGSHAFERLDSATPYLWLVGRAIFWAVVFTGVLIIGLIRILPDPSLRFYGLVGFCSLCALAGLHLIWPFLSYRHWGFAIRRTDVLLKSGVVFKRLSAVPFARIQHVDSDAGPIERMFGVANLIIHTAGAHAGSLTVPGLPNERAEALRDYLSQVGHTHANI